MNGLFNLPIKRKWHWRNKTELTFYSIEDNIKIAIEHNLSFAYNEEMTKVSILVGLIPTQLSEEETREKIQEIFSENNFTNMGEAMKIIIPKLGGIADKKLISKIVKEMF